MGIGPTQPAWKASVLPLNYTRRSALRPNRARLSPNEALRVNSMLIDYSKYYLYCQLNFKIILFNFLFYNLKLYAAVRGCIHMAICLPCKVVVC